MAVNPYVNKVVYGNDTLIDLTQDTVTTNDVLSDKYFHLPSGQRIQGTCTYDADTSNATASDSDILEDMTAYVNGQEVVGSMPNIGGEVLSISDVNDPVAISAGYHDGSGYAEIDSTEAAKIIDSNIKLGIEILGVTGTYSGEAAVVQSKTVTSSATSQTVLPDQGYDYLSQVTVNAMPYVETDNLQGGKTVTIG